MVRLLAATAAAGALAASQAIASPAYPPADGGEVMMAAADCYSVGEQVAAQYGGTLAKASQQNRGGQTVCVIVVLVPGKDGQRPRRTEVVVPAELSRNRRRRFPKRPNLPYLRDRSVTGSMIPCAYSSSRMTRT